MGKVGEGLVAVRDVMKMNCCQCDVQQVFMLLTGQYNYNDKEKKICGHISPHVHWATIQILRMPDYPSRPAGNCVD